MRAPNFSVASLIAALFAMSLHTASATTPTIETPTETLEGASNPITTLSPLLVEATEPRYVAPTLRDRIGRIWVPVHINGKGPFRLVLDTGANGSAVLPSVAQALGLSMHESKKLQLHGVTGSAVVPFVSVDKMEVGDLYIDGARLPVVPDVFGGAEGVLGTKGLADKRIFIDFRNDAINIARSRSQEAPLGFSTMPIKLTSGHLLQLDLRIGSVRTKAILDTGAQTTIGNNALRAALMRRGREASDQTIVGITLDIAHGKSIPVPPIALGAIEIRNMNVTFGDMYIFEQWKLTKEPAMLIGMDVIGTLDTLIIDYKRRELQMRARR